MAKVIRKEMKASELPSTLAAGLDATPDQIVRVTVRPRRDARLLLAITARASAAARQRGMTRQKLAELLDDA
jgi:hypothetical protein